MSQETASAQQREQRPTLVLTIPIDFSKVSTIDVEAFYEAIDKFLDKVRDTCDLGLSVLFLMPRRL